MNAIKSLLGYTVHVKWEGKIVTHYTWTRAEAVEWMKCYPIEAYVWISHTFGSVFHAARRIANV